METVRNYYKSEFVNDSEEQFCIPNKARGECKECSFAKESLFLDYDQKLKILLNFGYVPPENEIDLREALDYIREFPVFVIKKGMSLCHSTEASKLITIYTGKLATRSTLGWWKEFFVGHSKYNGGWFTYESSYGGPMFGMSLYYQVQEDTPVLFVPNYFARLDNRAYYPDEQPDEESTDQYGGSHIVHGVKNWKEKGYEKITPVFYADQLAEKLVKLGFPGYISCDECEVFITHKTMKKTLYERPYRMVYENLVYFRCPNCNRKTRFEKIKSMDDPVFCKCGQPIPKKEDIKTIFHIMVEILCPVDTKCPLRINDSVKDRDQELDLEVLSKEKILKLGDPEFIRDKIKEAGI
jgi:hypothetical protein